MSTVTAFNKTHANAPATASLRIALAGNPNCGKTTVFNGYTGARQHVGNYPGVTVDKKEGEASCGGHAVTLVDLPGTYSLTAFTQEEIVSRRELSSGEVHAVIDVVEASALERNLLPTVQILEMGIPLVLACNMMDEAKAGGIHLDLKRLSQRLQVPVFPMTARDGKGLPETLNEAVQQARSGKIREPLRISYGSDIDKALNAIEERVAAKKLLALRYHPHWVALKLLERDTDMIAEARAADASLADELLKICEETGHHIRKTLGSSMESVITDHRFGFIRSCLADGVLTQDPTKNRLAFSDKLDKVLTHAFFGPLIMLSVLYFVYEFTIEIGAYPQGWVEDGLAALGAFVGDNLADGPLKSLIVDGVIGGVGGVLSFVPLIVIMFSILSFLEDCGYMARMAYMMDRVFRAFGLHGASVMPYCVSGGIAGGCAIPGATASRTLRSPKERVATLLTLPFMTCGAKMPVFFMLTAAFFLEDAPKVMFGIMIAGWVFALVVAKVLRMTVAKGQSTPFVMELPPYRFPTMFSVLLHCWERAWSYMKKAGTTLLAISVILWASMQFPGLPDDEAGTLPQEIEALQGGIHALADEAPAAEREALEEQLRDRKNILSEKALAHSIAGRLGQFVEPVMAPLGFDWRTNISLVAGVVAKEAVLSTMGPAMARGEQNPDEAGDATTVTPLGKHLQERWGTGAKGKATALALMFFVLLYSPCFVTLIVIKQEAGSWKWLVFSVVFNTALAYAAAFAAYNVGMLVWS